MAVAPEASDGDGPVVARVRQFLRGSVRTRAIQLAHPCIASGPGDGSAVERFHSQAYRPIFSDTTEDEPSKQMIDDRLGSSVPERSRGGARRGSPMWQQADCQSVSVRE